MKNPALMANQIRELYALLTPSMTYRLQISSRPITPSDIDLTLISTELDKMNADSATASEPELECVPPDPKKILLRTTYTKQGACLVKTS